MSSRPGLGAPPPACEPGFRPALRSAFGSAIAVSLALGITGAGAAPAAGQLEVDFDPDTLLVRPGQAERGFVTFENTGEAAVSSITYEWLPTDGLAVEVQSPLPGALEPGDMASTTLAVAGRPHSAGSRLLLRVSYEAEGRSRVVTAGLRVSGRSAPGPSEVVDLAVVGTLAGLHDGDEGYLLLQVSNKTDYPVSVDSVIPLGPEFIAFDTARADTVAARAIHLIRMDLNAKDWVRPGTHTLFFVAHLGWPEPDGGRNANLVVSRDVEIGVLGESEMLQLLSVPSFLLLPGFLMVIAFVMARRSTHGEAIVTADPKKPEFWVLAVFLSLLWVYLYPLLPGGRSYLRGYGMADVASVWAWSIGLGVASAVGVHALAWHLAEKAAARQRQAEADLAARTPAVGDTEIETLRKLTRRGQTIRLPQAEFEFDGQPVRGFVLEKEEDGASWVAPEIRYAWDKADTDQRSALELALESKDPAHVATQLEQLRKAEALTVYWHMQGSFAGPRRLEVAIAPTGHGYLVAPDDV